jgi:putative acyl-CoA dehydrogenase
MNARAQPVASVETKTSPIATHEVRNQARPPLGFNAFDDDRALSGLIAKLVPWAKDKLSALGAHAGCEAVQEAARLANEHEPKLVTHDRYGNRNDWVEFHPAWHQLMALAFQSEVHSLAWSTNEPNGHLARAALSYLWNQIENGVGCPTGMAYAAIAGFSGKPQFAMWRERTLAADYDPRRLPLKPSVRRSSAMR